MKKIPDTFSLLKCYLYLKYLQGFISLKQYFNAIESLCDLLCK